MEKGDTSVTSTNSTDLENNQQGNTRRSESNSDYPRLALPKLVAGLTRNYSPERDSREMRRSIETRRQNEETEENVATRRATSILSRGERGERLFKWILKQRGLTEGAS
jgi:hypothetical protein